jgi:hypothetical protein
LVPFLQGINEYIHSLWNLVHLFWWNIWEIKWLMRKHVKNLTTPFKMKLFLP